MVCVHLHIPQNRVKRHFAALLRSTLLRKKKRLKKENARSVVMIFTYCQLLCLCPSSSLSLQETGFALLTWATRCRWTEGTFVLQAVWWWRRKHYCWKYPGLRLLLLLLLLLPRPTVATVHWEQHSYVMHGIIECRPKHTISQRLNVSSTHHKNKI